MNAKRGLKIIWGIATFCWVIGVGVMATYTDIGPGTYYSGLMIGLTWLVMHYLE